jgi:hypothetical protein
MVISIKTYLNVERFHSYAEENSCAKEIMHNVDLQTQRNLAGVPQVLQ